MSDEGYKYFNDKKGVLVVKHYQLRLASGDALEPFYYRILYALRNNRQYKVIKKVKDYYNIGPNTQQFGFASQNMRQDISSASSLLGQIGQVVKSIVAMKKDKQRIDECLGYFKDKGKPNDLVLKGLWADFVDSKTGAASLAQAAQKLEFFVARDWFFKANSVKELEDLEGVTGNLKNFLIKKYREYDEWKKNWKPRLEDMKGIIDQQIKASKKTVDLYKQWIQPLLRNVEALKMAPDPLNPDLLKIGGSTYSEVEIVAWHKVEPRYGGRVSFTYEPLDPDKALKKDMGEKGKALFGGKDVPFMPLIHIVLTLRAAKDGTTETVVDFYSKVYDKKRFEELYWDEWVKDSADEWIDNLMLKEELPLKVAEEGKAEAPKDFLSVVGKKIDDSIDSFKKFMGKFKLPGSKKGLSEFDVQNLIKAASGGLKGDLGVVYFVVKKSFGMLAEFSMYMS